MSKHIDIVFTDFPGPGDECVFVEVEDDCRRSVCVGTWMRRDDGHVVLRFLSDLTPEREGSAGE